MLLKAKEFDKFFYCWSEDLESRVDFSNLASCDSIFYDIRNTSIKLYRNIDELGKVLYEL